MKSSLLWPRLASLALVLLASAAYAAQTPAPVKPAPQPAGQTPVTSTPVPKPTTQTPAPTPPSGQTPGTTIGPGGTTQTGGITQTPVPVPVPGGPQTQPGAPVIPAGPPGKLDCPVVDHDFGAMIEGEIARHTFDMSSTGENPLIIASAKPSCGCTISHVKVEGEAGAFVDYTYGLPIAPGKRVQLEAELNTKNKHNQAQSKINIQCNDPRQIVTLGLTAMVDTYFASTPAQLDFGEMSTTDSREQTAMISAKRGGKFKLHQEMMGAIPGFKVDIKPTNPDETGAAERWEVKVTMGPDCREGNQGYPVQLRSDQLVPGAPVGPDGQAPAYGAQVMVQGRVRGLISFEPQYLSFGLVRPGQELTRTLKISCFDDKFQLAQPKSMKLVGQSDAVPDFRWAENFEVTAKPAADGKTMDIDVTLKGMPAGSDTAFQGRVLIETGHPARPTIAVLFSGVCRANAPVAPTPVPAPTPPAPVPAPVKGN
ncbi:MAG TPA: DUF1573 domain-containing protein [Planctomycetota bacterium]|nr:DUF1573 domain-containing protein [Planctomycetota bacterium]